MNDANSSNVPEPDKNKRSYSLFLSLIRAVVEKHGGQIEIDKINNTFTIIISESRKTACLQELEEAIGPNEPIKESTFFIH